MEGVTVSFAVAVAAVVAVVLVVVTELSVKDAVQ